MRKLFFLFVALLATINLWAYDFQSGDLYYNITSSSEALTVKVASSIRNITTATIPETVTNKGTTYSVTSIGIYAFQSRPSLTSITIPNSVTSIEKQAFEYCTKLTSVTIGNSVTNIGENAFYECSSLTSITIPASVKSIGASAFAWCSSLTRTNYTGDVAGWCDIKFGDSDANPMGNSHNLYINGEETKDVIIPNTVDSIHDYTFYGCKSLTSVTIDNSVTSIGEEAFAECTSLYSITFPKSITSIGGYAFRGTLWYDNLPDGVVYIGKALYKYKGAMPANTSINITDETISISKYAFDYCSSLTSITIPYSVTSIGEDAFNGCTFAKNNFINNSALNAEENNYWGADIVDKEIDGLLIRNDTVISYRGVANSVVIPDGVVCIGGGAFYNLPIKSITIPNSVKSIGNGAFRWCYALSSIDFGNGIMTIGNETFAHCAFTSITIPNSVTSIGASAFEFCSSLTSIGDPENVSYIGGQAFSSTNWYQNQPDRALYIGKVLYEYIGEMPEETSFIVKEGTTHICQAAFRNCKGLMSVTIPNSVTSIGMYAFQNCSSLTSIAIPCNVTSVDKTSFYGCTSLASVVWNAKTSIDYNKFSDTDFYYKEISPFHFSKSTLKSITFGDSVKYIPEYICAYLDSLKYVTIGNSITNIGSDAFSGCSSLVKTNYTGSIGDWCNIKFGDSGANPICYSHNLYINDVKINDLIIPNSVDSIHKYAFYNCKSITSTTIPNSVTSIGNDAFYNCSSLTSVTIPNSVTSIGAWAFEGCSSLSSITIPNSVTSIGNAAFYNCSSLRSAIIGNGISKIENNTFENCSTLSYFAIGSRVENVGNRAFYACPIDTLFLRNPIPPTFESIGLDKNSISRIYVPCGSYSTYKNSSWNNYAKYSSSFEDDNVFFLNTNVTDSVAGRVETVSEANCDKGYTIKAVPTVGYEFVQWSDGVTDALRTLDLTQDTTLIAEFRQLFDGKCGDNLYWKHYDDKIIIHGEGTMYDYAADSVPWYQFRDIVKTVEVFDGATSIGNNAFALCKNLNTLTLPGTIENIGENAFGGCRMLFDIYCYILFPPIASENSFVNYNAYLYILCDYQRYYEADMVFGNFRNMQCIGTQSTPTDGMVITPSFNDVTITWPTLSNAGSYTLAINKDGEVFCTLTFNATGQLTGIAFAPSRNGQHHAPAATQAANGFTFTVTGLDEGTDYSYNLVIKDNGGKILQTYSGEFRTQSTRDRTVTVEYDATQGQVTGAGVYQIGDTVTLTAIPNDGYCFVRWSNDVENNPYTFVISENIMLSAEFTIEQTAVENITTNENIQKILRDGQLLILRDDKTYNIVGQIVE